MTKKTRGDDGTGCHLEADLMLLNKIDLLPHLDFDVERCLAYAREVDPDIEIIELSARSGEGVDDWYAWLERRSERVGEQIFA